jgi:hypothetical protein
MLMIQIFINHILPNYATSMKMEIYGYSGWEENGYANLPEALTIQRVIELLGTAYSLPVSI